MNQRPTTTRRPMTQTSSFDRSDDILRKVTKSVWRHQNNKGEPPIPTFEEIRDCTRSISKAFIPGDLPIPLRKQYRDEVVIVDGNTLRVVSLEREIQKLRERSDAFGKKLEEFVEKNPDARVGDIPDEYFNEIDEHWTAEPKIRHLRATDFPVIADYLLSTAGMPNSETMIEWLHQEWLREYELDSDLIHPLDPLVRAWLQERTAKHIDNENERKRPASTLPMKSAARVRDFFVESAETEIATSPPPAAQLMLPTLEVKQHLPEILPLEVLQGIPLQTQGRQQVSMAVRLFFEGVMMLNPNQHKRVFKKSLGELVEDLHPETKRIQKRDIDRVVKGIHLLDQIRIPYIDPVGGPGRFRPIRAWNEPMDGANRGFNIIFDVQFPSDDKGGMLVIKSIIRLLGQVSPSQLNAYLAACWIFNRYGRNPKNNLIDPTMPDPDSARDERGVLLHPETHRAILNDKGKGAKDIYDPAAVKVLDRVYRAEASAYPVLSFDELTRACYPGVNLNKTNKAKYHKDALQAWDELEQREIIRIIPQAEGYQILPSSEHINLHRAIQRPKR